MTETILHHGGRNTVTGSCHELRLGDVGILVDCGLLQGQDVILRPDTGLHTDTGPHQDTIQKQDPIRTGPERWSPEVDFPIDHIRALVITHVHIDHVGRLPYLLAAGYTGPIVCSLASAKLLPLVIEDAIKVGATRDRKIIQGVLDRLDNQIIGLPWGRKLPVPLGKNKTASIRLKPAGHILGSAYVTIGVGKKRIVFSGDLGAPYAPLIPSPKSPYGADTLVLESTYGDGLHPDRRMRRKALQEVLEHAFSNGGIVLLPAFSLGRTQELLYELEGIIHQHKVQQNKIKQNQITKNEQTRSTRETAALDWSGVDIIVDSPLAASFTEIFKELQPLWDKEAKRRVRSGRHPLGFDQIVTIKNHTEHLKAVQTYGESDKLAIVIASSGMCTGGRIVNWLKACLENGKNDVVFTGYQAAGTPGRDILTHGPRGGYVVFEGKRYPIRAKIHRLSSYSAHADQRNLVNFVKRMRNKPSKIRLVHGEPEAQAALAQKIKQEIPGVVVD